MVTGGGVVVHGYVNHERVRPVDLNTRRYVVEQVNFLSLEPHMAHFEGREDVTTGRDGAGGGGSTPSCVPTMCNGGPAHRPPHQIMEDG